MSILDHSIWPPRKRLIELQPCPFCGSVAVRTIGSMHQPYGVGCPMLSVKCPESPEVLAETRDEADKKWNALKGRTK